MKSFIRTVLKDPRKLALRRWLFQIHLWTGIGVGLYVLVISVSGSALVFREELEAAYPAKAKVVAVRGERASLEQVRVLAASHFPGYKVAWIHEPARPDLAYDVWVEKDEDSHLTMIDPYGAGFIGEVGATTSFWTFLQDLHFYLFAGPTGMIVNGAGGILIAVLCVSGVVIWWPGTKNWTDALKVDGSSGWKRFNWDLHSAGGMWVLLFVTIWALSGAYFAFPQPFVAAIAAVFPVSADPAATPPGSGQSIVPVDALVAKAQAAVPGHRPDWIGLPHHEGEHVAMVYLIPERPDGGDETVVYMNPYTNEVLEVRRPENKKLGDRVLSWFVAVHFGNFGGWPVKILWTVLGLTPAALFVTGSLMWWNRVLSKRWRRWREQMREAEARLVRR